MTADRMGVRTMQLLVLFAITATAVLGWLYTSAGNPKRVARFIRWYPVASTPEVEAYLASHLARTRRSWVTLVAVATAVCVVLSIPEQTVSVNSAAVLAAGLVGTAWPARRIPPGPDGPDTTPAAPLVARWIQRVPAVLGVLIVASTALVLALGPERQNTARVVWYGVAALSGVAVVALAHRIVVAGYRATAPAVEHAVRASVIATATAIGTLLVAVGLVNQMDALRAATLGPVATGIGTAEVAATVGATCIAVLLGQAGRQVLLEPDTRLLVAGRSRRAVRWLATLVVLVSAASLAIAVVEAIPPYAASDVNSTATIRFTDDTRFATDASGLGITDLHGLVTSPDMREFVGRIDLTPHPGANGTYYVVVMDSRSNALVPLLFSATTSGWDGILSDVPRAEPWLSAMRPGVAPDGSHYDAVAVAADPAATTSLDFVGAVGDGRGANVADLVVALIYIGGDNQIYWATKVPVTG